MARSSVDDFFGGGLELGRDVFAKAALRFRVRPPRDPAVRDAADRAVAAYAACLDEIVDEIVRVARQVDRGNDELPLVVAPDVAKAAERQPFQPGSRGGTWYRDSKGNVRYGTPPEGRFMGNAPDDSPMPHVDHLRPGPFLGSHGRDKALTGFLMEHGRDHGFSDDELRFLGAWYGTDVAGGELFDAFLECAGLTRDDLKAGVADLRFGSQQLTYEEAVFEFFAAQGSLFMGEEPTTPDQVEEWHRVLNDEIRPLLDGVFIKYEGCKEDEDVQRLFLDEPARQRRRLVDGARRRDSDTRGVAGSVVGDWDPERKVAEVVEGMRALGLLSNRARADRHARVHGRPHLADAVTVDARLLGDGPDDPLSGDGKLAPLSPSSLMLVGAAAELHRRWDPHTRSFSAERQADVGAGALAEAVVAELSARSPQWADAAGAVRARLADLVDRLVVELNKVNSREGMPVRHGPARRAR